MFQFHKSLNTGMTYNCKKSRKGFDLLVAVVVHVFFTGVSCPHGSFLSGLREGYVHMFVA